MAVPENIFDMSPFVCGDTSTVEIEYAEILVVVQLHFYFSYQFVDGFPVTLTFEHNLIRGS